MFGALSHGHCQSINRRATKHGRSRATINYPGHRQTLITEGALPWPAAARELDRQKHRNTAATSTKHNRCGPLSVHRTLQSLTVPPMPCKLPQSLPNGVWLGILTNRKMKRTSMAASSNSPCSVCRNPEIHSLLRRTQTLTFEFFPTIHCQIARHNFGDSSLLLSHAKLACNLKVSSWNIIRTHHAAAPMITIAAKKTRIRSESKHRDSRCKLHRRSFTQFAGWLSQCHEWWNLRKSKLLETQTHLHGRSCRRRTRSNQKFERNLL